MHKIFVSHASKDKAIVDIIVDKLLENGMGFDHDDIFYSSGDSMGIKIGEEWRNVIKGSLLGSEVVLFIITPNYKESEMCLYEMGAAWATHEKVIPIIVPSVTFDMMGVTFDGVQGIKLTDSTGLDNLRDRLHQWTSTQGQSTARWSEKKQEAKEAIENYIIKNPFPLPLSRDVVLKLKDEVSEAKQNLKDMTLKNNTLEEYIRKIEAVKDKDSIREIKCNMGLLSEREIFDKKVKQLRGLLGKIDGSITTIIFNEYTHSDLRAPTNSNAFRIAAANGIIDEEGNLDCFNSSVKTIFSELKNLEQLFDDMPVEVFEVLEKEYPDVELEFKNLNFWEKVIGVHMNYKR